MVADALRSTLDSLQLDPSVQKDRHYLITMLRRLGYTEVEIREALGEANSHMETEVTTVELEYSEEESEGLQDFEPVTPARQGKFVVATEPDSEFEEVAEELQDFEEIEPARKRETMFEQVIEEPLVAFEEVQADAWSEEPQGTPQEFEEAPEEFEPALEQFEAAPGKRIRLRVVHADSAEEAEKQARSVGHKVVHTVPVNVRQQEEAVDSWATPEFERSNDAVETTDESWDWDGESSEPEGSTWDSVEDNWETENENNEAVWADPEDDSIPEPDADTWEDPTPRPVSALKATENELAWPDDEDAAWDAPGSNSTETIAWDAPTPAAKQPGIKELSEVDATAVEAPKTALKSEAKTGKNDSAKVHAGAAYYSRNEYVLHMRKAKLPSGKSETLYFFAKGISDSGAPIELPAGYVVREHPGSKLPYIVREDP